VRSPATPTTTTTAYDHSAAVPEIQVSGLVAGRAALYTLRPALASSDDSRTIPVVAVDVTTRYRIPLTFTAIFRYSPDDDWELVRVLCDQDDYLASVRTVRPYVGPAAAQVLDEHHADLAPLLAIAQERQAAWTLSAVYRARVAAADAHLRATEADAEFALFGVPEHRAAAVLDQLSERCGLPVPDQEESHSGRPMVRRTTYGRVLVLCPVGHLVQSVNTADWHGSQLAAQCASPAYTVTCHGRSGAPLTR
jgi:hypothetical protein